MNSICSIFLTLFMVFRPLIPWVDYAVNFDYIKENLCINRAKPELNCNGKCYLGKEISQLNDTESPFNKGKNPVQKILDIYIPAEIIEIISIKISTSEQFQFNSEIEYSFLFLHSIFRPPLF